MGGTPVTVTPLKSEPLLRLLIADLVGEEVTREALATLREDLADLTSASTPARRPPRRCRTARPTCCRPRFLRGFVALHEELVDKV